MATSAARIQQMVTHWLRSHAGARFGTDYGSAIEERLFLAQQGMGVETQIAKLKDDIAIMQSTQVGVYSAPNGVDQLDVVIVAGGVLVNATEATQRGALPSASATAILKLSPLSAVLQADNVGAIASYTPAATTATVELDGIDITGQCLFSRVDGPGLVSTMPANQLQVTAVGAGSQFYSTISATGPFVGTLTRQFGVVKSTAAQPVMTLSQSSAVLAGDNAGNVSSYAPGTTAATVMQGATNITGLCAFTPVDGPGIVTAMAGSALQVLSVAGAGPFATTINATGPFAGTLSLTFTVTKTVAAQPVLTPVPASAVLQANNLGVVSNFGPGATLAYVMQGAANITGSCLFSNADSAGLTAAMTGPALQVTAATGAGPFTSTVSATGPFTGTLSAPFNVTKNTAAAPVFTITPASSVANTSATGVWDGAPLSAALQVMYGGADVTGSCLFSLANDAGMTSQVAGATLSALTLAASTAATFVDVTATGPFGGPITARWNITKNVAAPVAANTISLLHFEDINGTTIPRDEYGVTWANSGPGLAVVQSGVGKFGGGLARLSNGAGGIYTTIADLSGPWTAELFVRFDANPFALGSRRFMRVGGTNVQSSPVFRIEGGTASSIIPAEGVWYHVALVSDGAALKLYVNGNLASTGSDAITTNAPVSVGCAVYQNDDYYLGAVDEWRLSRSMIYTAPFTPPPAPFLPAAPTNPYAAMEMLKAPFSGANGAATTPDVSANGFTLIGQGGANITTAESVYGGSAADCTSGANACFVAAANPALRLTGSWCVEARVKIQSMPVGGNWYVFITLSDSHFWIAIQPGGSIETYALGTQMTSPAGTVSAGAWRHIAVSYQAATPTAGQAMLRLFLDGALVQGGVVGLQSQTAAGNWNIGGGPATAVGSSNPSKGFVDNFLLTIGDPKYTAPFTVPGDF